MKRVAKGIGYALVALATWLLEVGDRLLERAGDTVPPPPAPFGRVDRSVYDALRGQSYRPGEELRNSQYVAGPEIANARALAAPLPPPVQRRIPPPPAQHAVNVCRCPMCLARMAETQRAHQRARMKLN